MIQIIKSIIWRRQRQLFLRLCSEALISVNKILNDEAKQIYKTEPADIRKSHVNPSTDHNKHHTWLETLRIHRTGSMVMWVVNVYLLILILISLIYMKF